MNLSRLLLGVGANAAIMAFYHNVEKEVVGAKARQVADSLGKPLLNIGCREKEIGDVNCDISCPVGFLYNPSCTFCDAHRLPYPDKYFGAVTAFHLLEHVVAPEMVMAELERVADNAFILTPRPVSFGAWFNGDHRWVFFSRENYLHNPLHSSQEFRCEVCELRMAIPRKTESLECLRCGSFYTFEA